MQIKGNEFLKNVQIKQEREELEKKLRELESANSSNSYIAPEQSSEELAPFLQQEQLNVYQNTQQTQQQNINPSEHELENIMLGTSSFSNEENKKKYLILGVVLVVLFLLTIIIIRLLTSDSNKEDSFTSNGAKSSETKSLSDNNSIEENFQKIINDRAKKDSEQMVDPSRLSAEERLNNIQTNEENPTLERGNFQEEPTNQVTISNETLDETIKKIEEKKAVIKQEPVKKEVVQAKIEPKKSIQDLIGKTSTEMSTGSGYFVQVGAFTKKPSDSFINSIRNAKLKYKIYQHEVKGVLYNKVLIGPYSSKESASQSVGTIKESLNITNAHVVKF